MDRQTGSPSRLTRVTLTGYKRFAYESTLTADGDVVALVGPNEAGKTSVLQALLRLNDSSAFPASELSRTQRPGGDKVVISARFLLEPDDIAALADIPEAADVRWYTLLKRGDGELRVRLEPDVGRDTRTREILVADLRRAAAHRALDAVFASEANGLTSDDLIVMAQELGAATEDLDDEVCGRMETLAEELSAVMPTTVPKYIRLLPQALQHRADEERSTNPRQEAVNRLHVRRPRFLWFGAEQRSLSSSYELTELPDPRPVALTNLARLAQLDLDELVTAAVEARVGEMQGLRDRANRHLRAFFSASWQQAQLTVELTIAGTELQLYVRDDSGSYWQLDERSDGLRWFVALVCYLQSETVSVPPILLVDEAEQHLHYDGQADLVRAFERQAAAACVIYTTHSAGCLPQDLGTGVRVISRTDDGTSAIRNSLWDPGDLADGDALARALIQMGASTFVFAATRHAVICEGVSEVILLPTLLRECVRDEALPFQIVPGLANVATGSVPNLDLVGAKVAFLVDGDPAGNAIAKKLRAAGVDTARIVRLGPSGTNRTLEDLVDPDLLREAIAAEFARSGFTTQIPRSAIGSTYRFRALEKWCAKQKPARSAPAKTAVARHLVEAARAGQSVLQSTRRLEVEALYDRLLGVLDLPARDSRE